MNGKKIFCYLLFLFCVNLIFFGDNVNAASTIDIGFIGPFTGPVAFNGGEIKRGAMLAVDEINAKGGLFGMKVNLVFGDTESQPQKGVAVVKKLISRDKVLVVGGGYHSHVNIATSEVCEREKTPNVICTAQAPIITAKGYTYVFRTAPTAVQVVAGINEWLETVKKPKTVAFLMENSDYGRDAEKLWAAETKKLGAKDLIHMYFQIGDADFTTQISKLKELAPEVTFSVGSTTEVALITKQSKELNYVTQWVGAGGPLTEEFFKMVGLDSLYLIATTNEPVLATKDPITNAFVKAYTAKYDGARAGVFSSQAYDNMLVIFDAIKRAGKPTGDLQKDRDAIRNALPKTSVKGSQGLTEFDSTGQLTKPRSMVVQVQNVQGKAQLVCIHPAGLAAGSYQTPLPWNQR
jgi:branched-chain amino acid transport system substrate-binding protein